MFAPLDVPAEKIVPVEDKVVLFTHPLQVQVLRLPADAGVLFKYAESAELNRRLRSI